MAGKLRTFLEVVAYADGTVVKAFDVTDKSERMRERIEAGVQINLRHADFFTRFARRRTSIAEQGS